VESKESERLEYGRGLARVASIVSQLQEQQCRRYAEADTEKESELIIQLLDEADNLFVQHLEVISDEWVRFDDSVGRVI
jgi:hypothetical protein